MADALVLYILLSIGLLPALARAVRLSQAQSELPRAALGKARTVDRRSMGTKRRSP